MGLPCDLQTSAGFPYLGLGAAGVDVAAAAADGVAVGDVADVAAGADVVAAAGAAAGAAAAAYVAPYLAGSSVKVHVATGASQQGVPKPEHWHQS